MGRCWAADEDPGPCIPCSGSSGTLTEESRNAVWAEDGWGKLTEQEGAAAEEEEAAEGEGFAQECQPGAWSGGRQ